MRACNVAFGVFLAAFSAVASPIATLHSTGEAAQGSQDPYWTVTMQGGSTQAAYVTVAGQFPFPYWLADSSSSQWISPQASYTVGGPGDAENATYTYTTTFDLTYYKPGTAAITFGVAVDNSLTAIYLNSTDFVGSFVTPTGQDSQGYGQFHQFSIDPSALLSGVNTLTFVTENWPGVTGNPNGINVVFYQATADLPEPATWTLFGAGAAVIFAVRRRRASRQGA